jgi:excisionase family DNA binding protein
MARSANLREPPEGYVTTAEAAQRSGHTRKQIATLAKSGRLLARHVGTRWFIDRLALDAFVANRKYRKSRPKRGRAAKT